MYEVVLLTWLGTKHVTPEDPRLHKICISDVALDFSHTSNEFFMSIALLVLFCLDNRRASAAGNIIREITKVGDIGGSITPCWIICIERPICGKLEMVDSKSITLGIAIRKQANLQN